jgi:uncharacterized membrane protein
MDDPWPAVRFLHALAMAFFVGGQLVLVAAIVPVERRAPDPARMRAVARRFGAGTLVAIAVLLVTGIALAEHFQRWSDGTLQVKLGLVAATGVLLIWHLRRPALHALQGGVLVLSLAVVWLGLALAHGF